MVCPSRGETLANVVFETALWAERQGAIILAPARDGFPEQITDGRNGLLYLPGHLEALTEGIMRSLDLAGGERQRMRVAAAERDATEHLATLLARFWRTTAPAPDTLTGHPEAHGYPPAAVTGTHQHHRHPGGRTVTTAAPLLLVDGHNLLYRSWYGFPARIRARTTPRDLTGVFGFAALLRKAHLAHADSHEVVVVFDAEDGSAARVDQDPAYKAHRTAPEPGLIESLTDIKQVLDLSSVRWIEQEGGEGDDVIATLATTACGEGRSVDIMSVDKDFYQLLSDPKIRLLNTMLAEHRRRIDAQAVRDRFGVDADQWPDYRALTGDPSDGITGVRGIGPKTASRLLADGRRLETIPHQHIRPAWRPQWEQALRWREMIRLDRKVELPDNLLTGRPTAVLPRAAQLLDQLDLW